MIYFEIIENVNYNKLGVVNLKAIPPLNSHLIIQDIDYIIIDYVLVDIDLNNWKMVVRRTNTSDRQYVAQKK